MRAVNGADNGRCRLLLVEDHGDTRDMLARLLKRDFDVTLAGCFETALAAVAAADGPPQVLVTDLRLPGANDGLALMRELHQRYGIHGIAVTGLPVEKPQEFRDAGFVRWLTKPIRFNELLQSIEAACAATV